MFFLLKNRFIPSSEMVPFLDFIILLAPKFISLPSSSALGSVFVFFC